VSLSELQVTWNEWVAQGCPALTPRTSPSLEPLPEGAEEQLVSATKDDPRTMLMAARSGTTGDGWYSRKRRRALNGPQRQPIPQNPRPHRTPPSAGPSIADIATLPRDNQMARPQQPQMPRQIIVDPGQGAPRGYAVPSTGYPQTMRAPRSIPMTTPGTVVPMTTPGARPPMTMPTPMPMTMPVSPSMGNTPAPGVVYPISNAVPMTVSPYTAAPCFGSS